MPSLKRIQVHPLPDLHMSEDPYAVLGVARDSTDAEIKRAYRRLARQHHPDRNPDDAAAEERFKSIQSAYDNIGPPRLAIVMMKPRGWRTSSRMEGGQEVQDSKDLRCRT